jgi:hypothetical protein
MKVVLFVLGLFVLALIVRVLLGDKDDDKK